MQIFINQKPIPFKMVVNAVYLWCFSLSFIQITEAKCSQRLVGYWERQYRKNYFGDLDPWTRCKDERGFCLRKTDTCDSGDWVRYQTTCEDRCDCCFRKKRMSSGLDWVLVETRRTWEEARDDCRKEKNGDLVVPENVADLIKFIQNKDIGSADVWVGINDKFNGIFEGIYGNEVLSGWMQGHPRRQTRSRDNCVVVEDASRKMNDVGMKVEPCWAKNYYVCDVNRSNRRRHDVIYKSNRGDSDRHEYEGNGDDDYGEGDDKESKLRKNSNRWVSDEHEYEDNDDDGDDKEKDSEATFGEHIKIFGDRKTWEDAREDCKTKGGDLLIPRSMDDLLHYMKKTGIEERDIWLGFSDHRHNREYEGVHGNLILDDSLWQPGQPRLWEAGDNCIVIEDDKKGSGLKVMPCHMKLLYACDLSENFRDSHGIAH